MDEFYKDQKVHCKRNGNGVVVVISNDYDDHPIKVRFVDGYCESYTRDGKILIGTRETHLTPREEEEVMSKDFYVGQKVWCVIYGQGVVAEAAWYACRGYDIIVKFNDDFSINYTSGGKYCVEGNVTLFPHPVEVVKSATKPSIDWSQIKDEYKWLAVDVNNCAYVYENEPNIDGIAYWCSSGATYFNVNGLVSYSRGTCDWKDSLVKRPELVQEI